MNPPECRIHNVKMTRRITHTGKMVRDSWYCWSCKSEKAKAKAQEKKKKEVVK